MVAATSPTPVAVPHVPFLIDVWDDGSCDISTL